MVWYGRGRCERLWGIVGEGMEGKEGKEGKKGKGKGEPVKAPPWVCDVCGGGLGVE